MNEQVLLRNRHRKQEVGNSGDLKHRVFCLRHNSQARRVLDACANFRVSCDEEEEEEEMAVAAAGAESGDFETRRFFCWFSSISDPAGDAGVVSTLRKFIFCLNYVSYVLRSDGCIFFRLLIENFIPSEEEDFFFSLGIFNYTIVGQAVAKDNQSQTTEPLRMCIQPEDTLKGVCGVNFERFNMFCCPVSKI